MTHSYEEIIRLDSQRAQGEWHLDNVCQHGVTIYTKDGLLAKVWSEMDSPTKSNAQYIAAMPDAVGLLKEFKADNTKLKQLLDRAMQGLEAIANAEAFDSWGDLAGRAETTLADIRKQLDGDSNGG